MLASMVLYTYVHTYIRSVRNIYICGKATFVQGARAYPDNRISGRHVLNNY